MNKFQITAFSAFMALTAIASAADISTDEYQTGKERIEAEHTAARSQCGSLAANGRDVCIAGAAGKAKVARAELDARHEHGAKSDYGVMIAKADAGYGVARKKCDDLAGIGKAVCIKEAKADRVRAKADAKTKMKVAQANRAADEKSAAARVKAKEQGDAARHDSAAKNRDADFSVAMSKCSAFSGSAKSVCMEDARARYWPQS